MGFIKAGAKPQRKKKGGESRFKKLVDKSSSVSAATSKAPAFDMARYAKKNTHRTPLTKDQIEASAASHASASAKKQPKGGSRSDAVKKAWLTRKGKGGGKVASVGGGMRGFKPGSKAGIK